VKVEVAHLTSGKYAKLAKCSPDIRELMEYGILRQGESGGRSTSYEMIHFLEWQ